MSIMKDIDIEIQEAEQRLESLKKQKEGMLLSGPDCDLAIAIHNLTCRYNHTDQCGWEYEIHNNVHAWNEYAHAKYLGIARRVLKVTDAQTATNVLNAMRY